MDDASTRPEVILQDLTAPLVSSIATLSAPAANFRCARRRQPGELSRSREEVTRPETPYQVHDDVRQKNVGL
jgi:hypothetical protein